MPKKSSYGICKNTTANSSARFFSISYSPRFGSTQIRPMVFATNVRRLIVPAGSRRQKSIRAYMSVPCTLYQVSDTLG